MRIANISHLAGVPFTMLRRVEGAVYEENSPTENARRLHTGEVDVALIPAADFFERGCYQSLEFGLGCRSRSDSMVLYANDPVESLHTIHTYKSSCSSLALLRLLLLERWQVAPRFVRNTTLTPFDRMGRGEGALVLHDYPGQTSAGFLVRQDVATAWHDHTGLPFVFLIWAVRPGVLTSAELDDLQRWFARGTAAADLLARHYGKERGVSEDLCSEFVAGHRRYYLDDFLLHGLEDFLIRSQKQGAFKGAGYYAVRRTLFGEVVCRPMRHCA